MCPNLSSHMFFHLWVKCQSSHTTRRMWNSIFIPSSNIHRPYQWGLLKSETLWWKRWFQLFDCELSIYKYIETFKQTLHMEYIYPSVDTTFQRLWFISWFPWYMAVANIEFTVAKLNLSLRTFSVATVNWLTVTEYLPHKSPRICSVCCNHYPVLSSFMTYYRLFNKSNMTSVTSGAGSAYYFLLNL